MSDDERKWLDASLRQASASVAAWPEWKKQAMRVIPAPERPMQPPLPASASGTVDKTTGES